MPDDLASILPAVDIAAEHVGQEELRRLGAMVTAGPLEEFILHPARMPGLLDDQERPPDYFEIHDRDWWIDARHPAAQAYLTLLLSAAAVIDALDLDHTLWWVTKVLPAVLSIDRVTLSPDGLQLVLGRRRDVELPPDLADDINGQDFVEFVDALAAASPAVPLSAGGTLMFT